MFATLGRWSYRHRRAVVIAWVTTVLGALPLVPTLPGLLKPGGFEDPTLESSRAIEVMLREIGPRGVPIIVVFPNPPNAAVVSGQAARASQLPFVGRIVTPAELPRLISPDGSAAMAVVELVPDADWSPDRIAELKEALGHEPLQPLVTGAPVAYADIVRVSEEDLRRAELISIPLALVALIVVFGSLIAAGAPVVVGGLSVALALAMLALVARVTDLSVFVLNLTTMLGLGLSTDYSLFVTSRFREELRAGHPVPIAVERATDRAGRAVFFSGLTVFIGLLGLVSFDFMMLRSLGVGGALVVATGVAASVTLLPALLGMVGHRIDAFTVFRVGEAQAPFWRALALRVMARPWPVLVAVLLLLAVLGAPFASARFALPDAAVLPPDVESRRGYDLVAHSFGPGETNRIVLVVESAGPILSPQRIDALFDLSRYVASDPMVARVESIVDADPRITRDQYKLLYAGAGDPYTRASLESGTGPSATAMFVVPRCSAGSPDCDALVGRLRSLQPGAELQTHIGGTPAAVVDIVHRLYETFPRAILLIVATTYVALLLLFRSLLLPAKAIAMNTLSLVASYGALVVVFQQGFGASLLGFEPLGYVEATLPIILFCVLFGLSMDYEVFLLSRIREEWLRTRDNVASVAAGLASSGRVITNAALIVVLVSLSFVTAEITLVKAVGLGTALAVLLDATVVRALLVPATMRLFGRWNWWLPGAAALLLFASCAAPATPAPRSQPVPLAQSTATPTPRSVSLPADDAAHGDLTEWWYYTGHLDTADGGTYGFELVFFQSVRGSGPLARAAHFALTDPAKGRFIYDQRAGLGDTPPPPAGFDLSLGDWRIRGSDGRDRLKAQMGAFALDVSLESQKPPALHNSGLISFGAAGASYYYSRTRMGVAGTLTVDDTPVATRGEAWMDHQWGNFVSAGGGWDWFALQLDDRSELTGSIVRDDAGRVVLVYGTHVSGDGRSRHLDATAFRAEATSHWTSPHSGATYPARWRIRTTDPPLDLDVRPILADQELDTRASTGVVYWEGAVAVTGTHTGRGYVELTGYSK